MKRFFEDYLISWKSQTHRKPLIVRGARQVGKTYSIKAFGVENFDSIVEINFEETPELKQFFTTNDVEKIIRNLEIYFGKKINSKSTLLFLDEIQTCPEAINSLRYFYEKMPDLHVIAAGSLLDHILNDLNYSMPVGRVEFAYMYPMSFYEFLISIGQQQLVHFLKRYTLDQTMERPIHLKLVELLRLYFLIGGMPEAISVYNETKSLIDVQRIHESILKSLEFDFSKYGTRQQQEIMVKLLRYIPKTIGQKFKYVNFDNTIRSNAIRSALNLLSMSRIIHLVYNTKSSGIPLEAGLSEKTFKPLFFDIGLSNHALKLNITDIQFRELTHRGSLAEQFIGQELICLPPYFTDNSLYYWIREKRNSEAEIDYLIEAGSKMVPIEVKAGKTGRLKSLLVFMAEKKLEKAIRFNTDLPTETTVDTTIWIGKKMQEVEFRLISLPLYLVPEYHRFL